MKRIFYLTMALFATFSLSSCGGDEPDPNGGEIINPTKPVADPEGTITLSMRDYNNGCTYILDRIYIKNENFKGANIASVGSVNGLGNVSSVPKTGWAEEVAVIPGNGYVARINSLVFVRIYVIDFITSTSGGIIGADVKYQYPLLDIDSDMEKVSGGTFSMGATSEQGSDAGYNESPTHSVTLSDYYIGKYEVTQALWQSIMGGNPSYFKGDNLPVENVSWNDCQTFITKLNQLTGLKFRLPTEAEWEYAARGGNKSKGYKYAGSNTIGQVAWYNGNSSSKTHPVGQKLPNELGIYDMSGNVWEWCQDWYGDYNSSSQTNPTGPSSGSYRVARGGGCYNDATGCRVSGRDGGYPTDALNYLGFRLALSL